MQVVPELRVPAPLECLGKIFLAFEASHQHGLGRLMLVVLLNQWSLLSSVPKGTYPVMINQNMKVDLECTAPVSATGVPTCPFGHLYPPVPWLGCCCAQAGWHLPRVEGKTWMRPHLTSARG